MHVFLLNPPAPDSRKYIREGRCTQEQGVWGTLWPPVSLAVTAAVLEEDGHRVTIRDCPAAGISRARLLAEAAEQQPGCIMWSTGTPSIEEDLRLAEEVRHAVPDAHTAVFGTHVTVLDRPSLESTPGLDTIIRNEPEHTARELVECVAERRPLNGVQGITWRNSSGDVVINPPRPFIEPLDSLPNPAWHLLDTANYRLPLKGRPFLIIAPQRGCPFNCTFCTCHTYYGTKLRKRSPGRVVDEIEYNLQRFSISDFFFWAETFVLDRAYVASLCREILSRELTIAWTCNSRVDVADKDLLRLMAHAGCWMISYGIESADQKVLDASCKNVRADQFERAVSLTRRAGIKTAGHFIFGLPEETPASMERTLDLALHLDLDIAQFYSAVPFPGSRLYETAQQEGWISGGDFSLFRQDCAIMALPTVSPDSVDRFRSCAYRRFYMRAGALWRIAGLAGVRGFRDLLKTAGSFVRWSKH